MEDSSWEPDGVTLQVRFCEEPGTNRRMAEIMWHRRKTRRQTENTNISLTDGEDPAYSPNLHLNRWLVRKHYRYGLPYGYAEN